MKFLNKQQKVNGFSLPFDDQNELLNALSHKDRESEGRDDEEDLDESAVEKRQDWGDIDPSGGDAPLSPGSAV